MRIATIICLTVLLGSCQMSRTNFNKQKFTNLRKVDPKEECLNCEEPLENVDLTSAEEEEFEEEQGTIATNEPLMDQHETFIDTESDEFNIEKTVLTEDYDYSHEPPAQDDRKSVEELSSREDEELQYKYDKGKESLKSAGLTFLTGMLLLGALLLVIIMGAASLQTLAVVLLVLLAIDVIVHFVFVYRAQVLFSGYKRKKKNSEEPFSKEEKRLMNFSLALSILSAFAILGSTFGLFGLMVFIAIG